MTRTRSTKVDQVKERLRTRLREGVYRPGDRFLSTRELMTQFAISYQTAHLLMEELCAEGWLERRAASGTYIPGKPLQQALLVFNARARREQSFGARLLAGLTAKMERDQIPFALVWEDESNALTEETFPICWETPALIQRCIAERHPALLLNDRPPPGLWAALLDSVATDDFCGGACAAELLLRHAPAAARLATLTGPATDARSRERRNGFLSLAPQASVIESPGWYFADGLGVAAEAVSQGTDGLFCGNDRLAEAVMTFCAESGRSCPRLVGFDDAPVAERLNLTTIAIPWDEMISDAVEIVRRRLSGDTSSSRQRIIMPRPIVRAS